MGALIFMSVIFYKLLGKMLTNWIIIKGRPIKFCKLLNISCPMRYNRIATTLNSVFNFTFQIMKSVMNTVTFR